MMASLLSTQKPLFIGKKHGALAAWAGRARSLYHPHQIRSHWYPAACVDGDISRLAAWVRDLLSSAKRGLNPSAGDEQSS